MQRIDGDVINPKERQRRIDLFNAYVVVCSLIATVCWAVAIGTLRRTYAPDTAIIVRFDALSDTSIDCFLLTTHVGGLGISLVGADRVVICE